MQNQFLSFLQQHKLVESDERVLLAVSGGIDSVVMTDLFINNNFSCALVHCNFGLRGKASDGDEAFVKNWARELDIPCFTKFLDPVEKASREKISLQMAARNLRYGWFNELLESENYQKLATAHHADDLLETMLLNLTRGTGINGLHGILPRQNKIIHPILFAGKQEIENYAWHYGLKWREDASNQSLKYRRNLIRHQVVPVLREINPDLTHTIIDTSERIQAAETFYNQAIHRFKDKFISYNNPDMYIRIAGLTSRREVEVLLWEILKKYQFTYKQTKTILKTLAKEDQDMLPGKMFYSPYYAINLDREYMIVSPVQKEKDISLKITADQREIWVEGQRLMLDKLPAHQFRIAHDPRIAALDFDRLKFPLYFRKWRQGDRFVPLGMKNEKKLSDFMIDKKIPINLKNRIYVLISGKDIVWVVGYRIDNRYRVTNFTKTVFQIAPA